MHELAARLFRALEHADLPYCLLRDEHRLDALDGGGEIDLLVPADGLACLRAVALGLGFADLARRGHDPHHFFVAYDPASDTWLKLDVVTRVAYGMPDHALSTDLAEPCLRTRRRAGPTYGLAPETAFVTLLLHCLLDKGAFPDRHRARLAELGAAVTDTAAVTELLARYGSPGLAWSRVAGLIQRGGWESLLAERGAVAARMAAGDRLGIGWRTLGGRWGRKLDRAHEMLRPRLPTLALLAPDGAGKSTLAEGIAGSFYFKTHSVYMGLYQKGGRRSRLARVKGLGLVGRLLTQWRRYLRARYQQGRGRLVIFDRYTYDATLPARGHEGALRRARRWLLARACPPPGLVVLLDAPGAQLFARKGEHSASVLEAQRQHYLALRPLVPQMTVVDATNDADQVRRDVLALIWRRYAERGPRAADGAPVGAARARDGMSWSG